MSSKSRAGVRWFGIALMFLLIGVTAGGVWTAISWTQSKLEGIDGRRTSQRLADSSHSRRLAANDQLKVTIVGLFGPGIESIRIPHVGIDGKILLPPALIIAVAGLSTSEAEEKMRNLYSELNLVQDGSIHVERLDLKRSP
jgi:hypothetical protein